LTRANRIFLDTSFSIALAIEKDSNHKRAVQLSTQLEKKKSKIITTQAVILEIGNALSKQRYRASAVEIIKHFETDPNIAIVSLSDDLIDKAFELFSDRTDKEWGLVDCVSFVVMRERGINSALTADEHFVQAGFRALLCED